MFNNTGGKGPWSLEEDDKLQRWVDAHGALKWSLCSDTIPGRSGKQCRERWFNNLDPDVKKGNWSAEEDDIIFQGYLSYGSSWSRIAKSLEGRTENSVKNRFYSTVRKLLSDSHEKHEGQSSEQQIRSIIEKTLGKKVGNNTNIDEAVKHSSQSVGDSDFSNSNNVRLKDNQISPDRSPAECDAYDAEEEEDEDEEDENSDDEQADSIYNQDEDDEDEDGEYENEEEFELQQQKQQEAQQQQQQPQNQISNQSLNEIVYGMNNNLIKKRKYKKKRQEEEYCEQNLLYRLLKSNDVAIKNTKCLQDYSVFYRKYKQKKNLTNKRRRLEKQLKLKQAAEEEARRQNGEILYDSQVEGASLPQQPSIVLSDNNNNNIESEHQLKISTNSMSEDPSIETKLNKKELKATSKNEYRTQQHFENANHSENASIISNSNSILQNKQVTPTGEDSDALSDHLSNMQQELMEHVSKSVGSFLKKFMKKSQQQSSSNNNQLLNKTQINRSTRSHLGSVDLHSEQVSQKSTSCTDLESMLGQGFQEQISKQMAFAVVNAVAETSGNSIGSSFLRNSKTYSEASNDSVYQTSTLSHLQKDLPANNSKEDPTVLNTLKRRGMPSIQHLQLPQKEAYTYSSEEKSESTPLIGEQNTHLRLQKQIPQLSKSIYSFEDQQYKQMLARNGNWHQQSQSIPHSRNNSNNSVRNAQNSQLHAGDYYSNNQIGSATSLWSNSTQVPQQKLHSSQQLQSSSIVSQQHPLQTQYAQKISPRGTARPSSIQYSTSQMKNMSISSLRELVQSSIGDSSMHQQSDEVNPLEQQDKKMMFLLKQLNTLEHMLISTKKELVKLETGTLSTESNESHESSEPIQINQLPSTLHQSIKPINYMDTHQKMNQNNLPAHIQSVQTSIQQQQVHFDMRNTQIQQHHVEVEEDYKLHESLQQYNKFEAPTF